MATYVLVPGAWLGGWAWDAVAQRRRSRDHDVHPVTLTGLGDRAAFASPEVDLERHVDDIVGPIEEQTSATSSSSATATAGSP
jgi:Alpha/beta hydrolase family